MAMFGPEDHLVADHVSKTYGHGDARVDAIKDVTLAIPRGAYLAVVGASGSGKSTLMAVLGLLDRATSGTYRVFGRETETMSPRARAHFRRETVGFIFQSFHLMNDRSVVDNVSLPLVYAGMVPQAQNRRAGELLDRVGLTSKARKRPTELSGGEQQRVAIARALANRPQILLADEPTGNLDSATGAMILDLFDDLRQGGDLTLLVVTHDQQVAGRAERQVRMNDGMVIEDTGTAATASARLAFS